MNERHDELASAWLDGELDDEERGTFAADEAAQRATRELARVRQALAEPVEVPAGLVDQQVSRALAALAALAGPGAEDEASDEARVVPMRRQVGGRFRSARSPRAHQGPWFARVAAVGVLVGGIGVGVAAVLDQDPAVQDGDVALFADPSDPGSSGDAAGGGGPEAMTTGPVDGDETGAPADAGGDGEPTTSPATDGDPSLDGGAESTLDGGQDGSGDGPDAPAAPRLEAARPDAEPGESATAAAPDEDQADSTAPPGPPEPGPSDGTGGTLAEVATAAQGERPLDPVALRDHLVDHFGPVPEWPADPGAAVQCAALAVGPANGRPQAVIPFERDGTWLELVIPTSDEPFFLVPPGCGPAA